MKEVMIKVPKGTEAVWQKNGEGNMVLTLVEEAPEVNKPVTERIKTFEDAMMATGMTIPLSDNQLSYLPKDVIAYMKLRIIAAALNELNETTLEEFPKLTTEEYRYYPWFYFYTQKEVDEMDEEKKKQLWLWGGSSDYASACGLASACSSHAWSGSNSGFSARLAVRTSELAVYFGQQFIDIWADYITPFTNGQNK